MTDALLEFRVQCQKALEEALKKSFPAWTTQLPHVTIPSNIEFGELSSSVAHEIARQHRLTPLEVAEKIKKAIDTANAPMIAAVDVVSGYINFHLNYATAAASILDTVGSEDRSYGIVKAANPLRVSVEHTSANPSGPLTMGHARNSILGDALAHLVKARGHQVNRRFYVDDVGRQVSILAYGYKLLNRPEPEGKVDQWFGRLYACVNCALQIETVKRKLKQLSNEIADQRLELQRNLDEWVGIAAELEASDTELFQRVLGAVQSQSDPEGDVQEIGRNYEKGEKEVATLVREVSDLCLEGIKDTLSAMEIGFDIWDWESQVIWSGQVEKALTRIIRLPFTKTVGQSASLDVNAVVEAYSLRRIPPVTEL